MTPRTRFSVSDVQGTHPEGRTDGKSEIELLKIIMFDGFGLQPFLKIMDTGLIQMQGRAP